MKTLLDYVNNVKILPFNPNSKKIERAFANLSDNELMRAIESDCFVLDIVELEELSNGN